MNTQKYIYNVSAYTDERNISDYAESAAEKGGELVSITPMEGDNGYIVVTRIPDESAVMSDLELSGRLISVFTEVELELGDDPYGEESPWPGNKVWLRGVDSQGNLKNWLPPDNLIENLNKLYSFRNQFLSSEKWSVGVEYVGGLWSWQFSTPDQYKIRQVTIKSKPNASKNRALAEALLEAKLFEQEERKYGA